MSFKVLAILGFDGSKLGATESHGVIVTILAYTRIERFVKFKLCLIQIIRKLSNQNILLIDFSLHRVHLFYELLLMCWMICSLFHNIFQNCSKSQAFFVISLNFLFKLLRTCVFNVLPEHFELFITLHDFIFELTDLFLQRHDQESLLLILLSCLCNRNQILI